jgi:hypothetical protein
MIGPAAGMLDEFIHLEAAGLFKVFFDDCLGPLRDVRGRKEKGGKINAEDIGAWTELDYLF